TRRSPSGSACRSNACGRSCVTSRSETPVARWRNRQSVTAAGQYQGPCAARAWRPRVAKTGGGPPKEVRMDTQLQLPDLPAAISKGLRSEDDTWDKSKVHVSDLGYALDGERCARELYLRLRGSPARPLTD